MEFVFQQNVIRFINVELEDGVIKAFVEITIISAKMMMHVGQIISAILIVNAVSNVNAKLIKAVVVVHVVLMAGVFHAKNIPACLGIALQVGIVSRVIAVYKDVYMIMSALVAFIVTRKLKNV
jgi:hypothetical protein